MHFGDRKLGNFVTRNGTQENKNRYEDPRVSPNTKIWWISPLGRNYYFIVLIVSGPGSQVSMRLTNCFILSLLTYSSASFLTGTKRVLIDAPGLESHNNRHFRRVRKRIVGIEECLINSISQAGILSLAYITDFLRYPKVFLCIHIFYPSSCPTLHSQTFNNRWHRVILCSLLKKKNKEEINP